MFRSKVMLAAIAATLSVLSIPSVADADGYRLPPPEVVRAVDASPSPSVSLSPDGKWMLFVEQSALPSIEDLSRPMLRLAGMRIDPAANGRYSTRFSQKIEIHPVPGRSAEDVTVRTVDLPEGVKIGTVAWSHTSSGFAITTISDSGTSLWYQSVQGSAKPVRLTDRLNTILTGFRWAPDGSSILCALVPEERGAAPTPSRTPTGPTVQDTSGDASPLRTYQDLLKNEDDAKLFEHFATTVPARISLSGETTILGKPAIHAGIDPSPDGTWILVDRIERPFSFLMPYYRFPTVTEIWTANGDGTTLFHRAPLTENVPIGGVRTGPRSVGWIPNLPATLSFVEALDGGDPKSEVAHRDEWKTLAAPFDDEPTSLVKIEHRARGLSWFQHPGSFVATEFDRDRRWIRSTFHAPTAGLEPVVIQDRSSQDRYADPGQLVFDRNDAGRSVIRNDHHYVYRIGSGASPRGLHPFLDRLDLTTFETERLWQCEEGVYERPVEILEASEAGLASLITRRETKTTPPNYWLRRTGLDDIALTTFPDPTPELRGITKELVTYEREDGVPLSATLYLPPNYEKDTRLPLLVWAYPREYTDAKVAGQIRTSPHRFTRIGGSSHLHLLSQGYAIMDGATIPILGDPETMNDTFVEQLVAGAQAAVDYAVERGVADRDRVGVGGHSYGAFMTANLLAHCDLFAAGVARSGAYNRTLTPFGFQSERRTLWEAPETYFTVSPFMHAHKIDEPVLLIHGEADNNSGTFPMQSRRLFQAIKGNGGTARLVMLPNESHGYRARESILHTLAETVDWFDTYVKNRGDIQPAKFREE